MPKLKNITHTYVTGRFSTTLIIPIDIARRYGIDKPSNVIVEGTENGILIRKMEV